MTLRPRAPGAARAASKATPRDPLDLGDRVLAGVVGAVAVAAAVAEVDAAGQLADDEQVGARDPLLAQRAGADERRARPHRAQVRVEAEALAEAEQALLGPRRVGVGGVPLRSADRAEQHGVGPAARLEHLVGERVAVGVDRGAADQLLVELEIAERLEHPPRGGDDLGPDPVAGQERRSAAGSSGASRRDVEADVVERQRAKARLSSTASRNGSRRSSGQPLEVRRRGRPSRGTRAGSRGLDGPRPRASSGPRSKPARLEALLGVLGRGEVPGPLAALEGRARSARRR